MNLNRTTTLGTQIEKTGGFTSGFDYLRLILAILVMYGHSFIITGDNSPDVLSLGFLSPIRGYLILPMFFTLSGFLVASSLIRTNSLISFLLLRGLRIVPALFVEIALSAIVLGPLLTELPTAAYFRDIDFYRYFLNVIGYIHYHLPGLFFGHPVPRIVNGSLWTVPYEAECYIALAVLAYVGLRKRVRLYFIAFLVFTLALCVYAWMMRAVPEAPRGTATGRQLVLFFLAGVLLYLGRGRIPSSGKLALFFVIVSVPLITSHVFIYLLPLPIAYITAYLGLMQPKKLPIVFTGDYSYGIYLYAYPMQQAVYQVVPATHAWYINFFLALIAVSCFAAFSWHFIEKPMLKLKRFIIAKRTPRIGAADQLISPDKSIIQVAEAESGASLNKGSLHTGSSK